MAEKRMFSSKLVKTDEFLAMPISSRCLYFHLGVEADDDGFIDNPNTILKMIGASDNDLDVLVGKGYLITFESGVYLITHWLQHNYLRKDRYRSSLRPERSLICIDKNKAYFLDTTGAPVGIPVVDVDKIRLDEYRLDKISLDKSGEPTNYQSVIDTFSKKICEADAEIVEGIKKWISVFDSQKVINAIDIATTANRPSYQYMEAILKNWANEKSKTNKFQNNVQRTYDYDDIQKKMDDKLDREVNA